MTGSALEKARTSPFSNRLRLLRWRWRRMAAGLQHGREALAAAPILFGNSFPKSGTHLLAQVLVAFPKVGLAVDRGMGPILSFVRGTGRRRSSSEILAGLKRLGPGDICFGHVVADPDIVQAWCRAEVAHFFVLRDPRGALLSHAFYIGDKAVHNVHHEYYQGLESLEERLEVSIRGRADFPGEFPNIRTRLGWYLDWLDCREVHPVRFEALINDREAALGGMLDFAIRQGFSLGLSRSRAVAVLSDAIDPQRSYTFRSGKTGEWKQHFTKKHKELFKEVAGDLLIQLGYEADLDW